MAVASKLSLIPPLKSCYTPPVLQASMVAVVMSLGHLPITDSHLVSSTLFVVPAERRLACNDIK
jgi:hypothetical protein